MLAYNGKFLDKLEFVALLEVQIVGEGFHALPFVLSF